MSNARGVRDPLNRVEHIQLGNGDAERQRFASDFRIPDSLRQHLIVAAAATMFGQGINDATCPEPEVTLLWTSTRFHFDGVMHPTGAITMRETASTELIPPAMLAPVAEMDFSFLRECTSRPNPPCRM